VWSGRPPPGAVPTARTYVHHLRQLLEPRRVHGSPSILVTQGRGYCLQVDRSRVDAWVFEDQVESARAALDQGEPQVAADRIASALGLWRGPMLADLADYDFVRLQTDRFEELRLTALELRAATALALARHQVVAGELEELVRRHPLREGLHALLILAYYRSGRQADSLAAYQQLRRILADDLGVEPSLPLQRLHAAVLAQDPALEGPITAPPATRPPPGEAGSGPVLEASATAASVAGSPAERAGGSEDSGDGGDVTTTDVGLRAGPTATQPPRSPAARAGRARPRWHVVAVALTVLLVIGALAGVAVSRREQVPRILTDGVGLLDPSTGELLATAPVGGSPNAMAGSHDGAWVVDTTDDSVVLVEQSASVARQTVLPVGKEPVAVTVAGEDVWVANNGDGTLTRIDARARRVMGRPVPVGGSPSAVVADAHGVYAADSATGSLVHVDAATDAEDRRFRVQAQPSALALGFGSLWIADLTGHVVLRVDPASGQVLVRFPVGAGPAALAVTADAVWVANSLESTVSRIDPVTGQLLAFSVGDGPTGLAAVGGAVWVADANDGTLARIDTAANNTVSRTKLGSGPVALASTPSGLWVAAHPFVSGAHRGGTLTVLGDGPPVSLDPALSYGDMAARLLGAVYDGLVAMRPTASTAGYQIVPDLAEAPPQVSPDGLTYTFQLRPGIPYSDGRIVAPEDFRRAIQRALVVPHPSPDTDVSMYYRGIVGAADCRVGRPSSCPLTTGIETDPGHSRVTFHLTAPDPGFLGKLTLTFASPTPPGAPWTDDSAAPHPGTGPYRTLPPDPATKAVRLVRNPHFRPWSIVARPDGYPDEIVLRLPEQPGDQAVVAALRTGPLDAAESTGGLVGDAFDHVALTTPLRTLSAPLPGTLMLYLNNRRPPFNDLHARRALSFAVDRAEATRLLGSLEPACQLFPPGFPGYTPMCTYSARTDGTYAPDASAAAAEQRQAPPNAGTLTVYSVDEPGWLAVARQVITTLQGLGYDARLVVPPLDEYYPGIYAADSRADVALAGWGADYPDVEQFFTPILSCTAPAGDGFCDPRLDRLALNAKAFSVSNPSAANALWTTIYQAVNDAAAVIPLANLPQKILVSPRVGNVTISRIRGPLYDQMWVR